MRTIRRGFECETRHRFGGLEHFHRAGFGGAHEAFFGGLEVVVAGEVQPAVNHVKSQFFAEIAGMFLGVGGGGVGGNADLASDAERGLALEGDDVGCGWVVEKIGVELGQFGVAHEGEREFAGGAAATKFVGVSIERGDDVDDGLFVDPQARV